MNRQARSKTARRHDIYALGCKGSMFQALLGKVTRFGLFIPWDLACSSDPGAFGIPLYSFYRHLRVNP